ncbi:class I SAM-dependent methyltransferase [Chitinophaga eiseniae]|uniref:Class I SAM-dependent methyltransferase n=1 Tax=Chitinophaga eiseniae TaxID=634771 RepID=A0A847SEC6_9BACT|nr:class I SAM-dependent methyltransferase [Chitinophaga eiseniae]NLR81530.1 class I SAM-dependent methyltransferase [Chitinophaga eiseniae]
MTVQLKVPATSRLVLEAAMQLYTSPLQQQYIAAIDFSETSRIFYELQRSFPQIIDTICLRKQSIRDQLKSQLVTISRPQVIILGAGLDPLSLYLLENYRENISRIIEVDNGYIEEKQHIYHHLVPVEAQIQFVKCDVTDTALLWSKLLENGYQEDIPTIIIFEGVIHYISNEAFIQTMQLFKTADHRNHVMLDYSVSEENLVPSFLPTYRGIREVMESYIGKPFNVNSRADMAGVLYQLNASLETLEPLCDIEKRVRGHHHFFHLPGEGIIEMLSFAV